MGCAVASSFVQTTIIFFSNVPRSVSSKTSRLGDQEFSIRYWPVHTFPPSITTCCSTAAEVPATGSRFCSLERCLFLIFDKNPRT